MDTHRWGRNKARERYQSGGGISETDKKGLVGLLGNKIKGPLPINLYGLDNKHGVTPGSPGSASEHDDKGDMKYIYEPGGIKGWDRSAK